ncbi:MAG: hypothetical protein GF329_02955 [Candidatus Lokiarchaeota archaeon]|nr:hypothetical protein [Candidatus Lokiarchaeota archaeon]
MKNSKRRKKSRRSLGLGKITEKDEFKHVWKRYPEHHNESWYFNALDFNSNTHIITRVGYRMGQKEIETMFIIILDRNDESKNLEYFNRLEIDLYPEDDLYGDDNITFECLEPMKKWRIIYEDNRFEVDLIFKERFSPFIYMSQEDPMKIIEKYGMEILKVAATRHYEQGMNVIGSVKLIENGQIKEERKIKTYGHRDHSWGTRDWVLIDGWNWVACQFDDFTMNFTRARALGKIIEQGFISTKKGHERVTNIEVETELGFNGDKKAPKLSKYIVTTPNRRFIITSKTWKSIYITRESDRGSTVVYEQIAQFELDGRKGFGISEYMSSINKE